MIDMLEPKRPLGPTSMGRTRDTVAGVGNPSPRLRGIPLRATRNPSERLVFRWIRRLGHGDVIADKSGESASTRGFAWKRGPSWPT